MDKKMFCLKLKLIFLFGFNFIIAYSKLIGECSYDREYDYHFDNVCSENHHGCVKEDGESLCDNSVESCCYDYDKEEHYCKDYDLYSGCAKDPKECEDQGLVCCYDDMDCSYTCKDPLYKKACCPEHFYIGIHEELRKCSEDDKSNCGMYEMCCPSPLNNQYLCAYPELHKVECPTPSNMTCGKDSTSRCNSHSDCAEDDKLCCPGADAGPNDSKCCQKPVVLYYEEYERLEK